MPMTADILGAGTSPLLAQAIAGGGVTGLVAVGTNQATALQLSATGNAITTSSASTGVKLPKTVKGNEIWIRNDSGQTITVYPYETSGTTFNAAASNVTVATAKTIVFRALSDTYWISLLTA
jgi:outer membrane lipoprotein SlyB